MRIFLLVHLVDGILKKFFGKKKAIESVHFKGVKTKGLKRTKLQLNRVLIFKHVKISKFLALEFFKTQISFFF